VIERPAPRRKANDLSRVLNLTLAANERFPLDVEKVALEISRAQCPTSPITKVMGDDLPGLEGMLKQSKDGTKWAIVYNNSGSSPGRIRFTLAHEFGHYMLHRQLQTLFECSQQDMVDWDTLEKQIEGEADTFASYLLMPLDDFRAQVNGHSISFDLLGHCADRYGVSLTAAALKWLECSPNRAVLVASRDDRVVWARSNERAYRSGACFATTKRRYLVPQQSVSHAANRNATRQEGKQPARVWFPREPEHMPLSELSFVSDNYDFTLTLLLMPDAEPRFIRDEEDDELLAPVDQVMRSDVCPGKR